MPELAEKCIESWKKFCPGYEIVRWDETNFDFNESVYAKEAYEKGKYAYVSDLARFSILYRYGGIYLDTDVEIIRDPEEIVNRGPFFGCEKGLEGSKMVAPGLGMGAESGMEIYARILEKYQSMHFLNERGEPDEQTVVGHVTEILKEHGFRGSGEIEEVAGVYIYPARYFCPLDYDTGELTITDDTYSIHHYMASWQTGTQKKLLEINRKYILAGKYGSFGHKMARFPYWVKNKLEEGGVGGLLSAFGKKLGKGKKA